MNIDKTTSLVLDILQVNNEIREKTMMVDRHINILISELSDIQEEAHTGIEVSPLVLDSINNAISVLEYIKVSGTVRNEEPDEDELAHEISNDKLFEQDTRSEK